MNHTANRPARTHGKPFVFQAAAAILFAAAMFGLWQSHKPAGPATMTLLNFIGATCPAALPTRARVTVEDGAYALNRWAYAEIADGIDPKVLARCAPHRGPSTPVAVPRRALSMEARRRRFAVENED